MPISYVIREKSGRNCITSEYRTGCIWHATAEFILKCRLKMLRGGEVEIYNLHKKNGFRLNAIFISVYFKTKYCNDSIIEFSTEKVDIVNHYFDEDVTNDVYLEESYQKKINVLVNKIKDFTLERSLTIPILINFTVSNSNHIFWRDYFGGSNYDIYSLARGLNKPLVI